jgi:hypothetical protein
VFLHTTKKRGDRPLRQRHLIYKRGREGGREGGKEGGREGERERERTDLCVNGTWSTIPSTTTNPT